MNNKSAIIYILLLLLVCDVLHNSAKANSGLFFQSHRVIPEKRTELNLTPDAPFSFQDGFSLNFEVHLRNEEHNYGYIVRVVLNDTLNIDLLSNKGWSHSQLFLMKGTQNLMDIPQLDSIPGFSNSDWFQVKLVINYKKQFITCVLNGKEWSIPAELPLLNNVRITFGLHTGQPYPSTDVAPMNLRNIRILDRQGQLLRKWSLLQHGDNEVYDEVKFSRATVRNGIWEIDHHIRWRKKASFIIPGTSLQFAPYQRPADGGVFITLKDTIYQYSIEKEKLDTIIVNSGHPYFTAASSLVYDSVYDELISYSAEQERLNRYSFEKNEWERAIPDVLLSYLHHSGCYIPELRKVVLFGGYGFYRYSSTLFTHSIDSISWQQKDFSHLIESRYLAAMGYWGENKVLLLGGYGSKSGKQEGNPENYYDLHCIDIEKMSSRKLWDFSNESMETFGNAMVVDRDKEHIYALSFANDRAFSQIRLNCFGIESPDRIYLADSIPYQFHDTSSYCTLFYNQRTTELVTVLAYQDGVGKTRVEIYTLGYPVLRLSDVLQSIPKKHSTGWLWLILIIGVGGVSVTLMILWKQGQKNVTRKDENDAWKSIHTTEVKEKEVTQPSFIRLLGGFQVNDSEGRDITSRFTLILRSLFIYMLLYSYKNANGITSEQLNEIFWSDMDKSNATNNRNVNISKLRLLLKGIGGVNISYKNSYWYMTIAPTVNCDYIEICDLLRMLREGNTINVDLLNRIAELGGRGELLPDITEEWVDKFKSEYLILLSDVLLDAYEFVKKEKDLMLLLKLSETMLSCDSTDENAIQNKCYALYHLGKKGLAKQCYENFCVEYIRVLGTKPDFDYADITGN
ncbi:hypothetical protein [Bacteroides congonensis]|jgi:two-component SAPR family response regulator|uniref:hypothetical protein n=1 Tax=Bacteroides congonensis TaxID=1871006 RepID=UPI0009336D28|nr:hypothetical protein [Bacteroides congonensis]